MLLFKSNNADNTIYPASYTSSYVFVITAYINDLDMTNSGYYAVQELTLNIICKATSLLDDFFWNVEAEGTVDIVVREYLPDWSYEVAYTVEINLTGYVFANTHPTR